MNRQTLFAITITLQGLITSATANEPLIESISKETLWENRDGKGETWFHPRACMMPGNNGQPAALMNLQVVGGSDYFGPVHRAGT